MDGTILVADDDRTIRTVLTQALTRAGCKVHATGSVQTLMAWVEEGKGDLVISDVVMPDGNGLTTLPWIRRQRPHLPVIVISAQNTMMTAIKASEAAAFDYLPKPFDLPDLMRLVARGLEAARHGGAEKPAAPPAPPLIEAPGDLPLIGHAPAMQALFRLVARVVNTDLPLLVAGETGTGKTLLARALHDLSLRRSRPFVTARAEDLESAAEVAALFDRAGEGTLVIERLADLDPEAQARLARRIDAPGPAPRLIATLGPDPAADMERGRLREDLFFRFSAMTLTLPPLRDRIEDLPLLATHFLKAAAPEGITPRSLAPEALALMQSLPWPGNLRQLETLIHRLVLTGGAPVIARAEVQTVMGQVPSPGDAAGGERLSAAVAGHLSRYFAMLGTEAPPAGLYDRILAEVERPLIEIALAASAGNQIHCAELLGINRNTLRKKIAALGIEVGRRRRLM